jgi:hypothetical protein
MPALREIHLGRLISTVLPMIPKVFTTRSNQSSFSKVGPNGGEKLLFLVAIFQGESSTLIWIWLLPEI